MISLTIAFVLAFVFRGFVVEAFIIPTGSMAPTLRGAHLLVRSPDSGTTWAVGPWLHADANRSYPARDQGEITVPDPVTGQRLAFTSPPVRAGDRIFVLKYLYAVFEPGRFDVVVFKNPRDPAQNYIKRLLGLPGEQVALVDGDLFTRDASVGPVAGPDAWDAPGWRIARKPERVQRVAWQPVFDSARTPLPGRREPGRPFRAPWTGTSPDESGAWDLEGPVYRFDGAGRGDLVWNEAARPVNDEYPYDHTNSHYIAARFPVSDVRLAAGIEPEGPDLSAWATVVARGHAFQAEIAPGFAAIRMCPTDEHGRPAGDWTELARTSLASPLPAGRITNVEFWHADQALSLWIDGEPILTAAYDWSPAQRYENATGRTPEETIEHRFNDVTNPFEDPTLYRRPRLSWQFAGSPVSLHRVRLDRDLHYQPAHYGFGAAPSDVASALATDPRSPATLNADQYFVCGDNSPQSDDSRLWDPPNPWIAAIDPGRGVVNRKLLIGKAFFVYFPSIHTGRIPVPDVGRMRFIW